MRESPNDAQESAYPNTAYYAQRAIRRRYARVISANNLRQCNLRRLLRIQYAFMAAASSERPICCAGGGRNIFACFVEKWSRSGVGREVMLTT